MSSAFYSGLNGALGITFDSSDNLYIANGGDNNIIKVDPSSNGTIFGPTTFNTTKFVYFNNLGFPNDYLYVMDGGTTIYKVDVNGGSQLIPYITGISSNHYSVVFDNNNNLYYTTYTDNIIYKIASGQTVGPGTPFITGITPLYGLAFDNLGNLYVCCNNTDINKYDSTGTSIAAPFIQDASGPINLAIDKDDNIYLTTYYGAAINKYDSSGTLLFTIYTSSSGYPIGGLAFDSIGNLYCVDQHGSAITKLPVSILCFNEGTKILCLNKDLEEEYIAIENLKKGDFVKSYKHGFRRIEMIGKNEMRNNPEKWGECMYKMEKNEEKEVFEELIVTGGHSILVDDLGEHKQMNDSRFGITPKIDDKYLLLSSVSTDFVKMDNYEKYTYYHFILENNGNDEERYGVWANGVLTETPSKSYFMQSKDMGMFM